MVGPKPSCFLRQHLNVTKLHETWKVVSENLSVCFWELLQEVRGGNNSFATVFGIPVELAKNASGCLCFMAFE